MDSKNRGSTDASSPTFPTLRGVFHLALYMIFTLLLGVCAGALVWVFFFLMNLGLGLIWTNLAGVLDFAAFPLVVCIIGGVCIGLFARRFGPVPHDMNEVMAEVKQTGRCDYKHLGSSFAAALLPLLFGGSVGPEAGLTGVIAGLCTWVGDRLRFMGVEFEEFTSVGTSAVVSAIFSAPLFGLAVPIAGRADGSQIAANDINLHVPRATKIIVYLCAIAGALGAMGALSSVVGSAGGLVHFDMFSAGALELAWALPMALAAGVLGLVYFAAEFAFDKLAAKIGDKPVVKCVLAGAFLGAVGTFLPFAMFAGESQAEEIQLVYTSVGALALFATAIFKVVCTRACLSLGWRGGHFFPIIFAGIALGYAFALAVGADPIFCVCVCTAALMGCVMRQPLMCALLLIMCFPVKATFVLLVAAAIGAAFPIPKCFNAPTPKRKSRK